MKCIIMYHYVREPDGIIGMRPEAFARQVQQLQHDYNILSLSDLQRHDSKEPACALTFDDGLKDGIRTALPILRDLGAVASFYIATAAITTGELLNVQRRHLLLATLTADALMAGINAFLPEHLAIRPTPSMQTDYLDELPIASLKWTLDHLDPELVTPILRTLIAEHVGSESSLAADMYLNAADVGALLGAGMEVGGHGHTHTPLGQLYYKDQHAEMDSCRTIMRSLIGERPLLLSYPSGSYTPLTLRLAEHMGFSAGLTIRPEPVTQQTPSLELGRYDCTKLPLPASGICGRASHAAGPKSEK